MCRPTTPTIELASSLKAHRAGNGWMARCPAHYDRTPSLSITDRGDGVPLFFCHAGCSQEAVVAALRQRGLWSETARSQDPLIQRQPSRADSAPPSRDDGKRTETALSIWQAATPAGGTLVQTYLVSRGLNLTPPPTLRFHGGLKHPSGDIWPAMVALVTRGTDDTPMAIHRTFLARDGMGKAPVVLQQMMLGPCRGGAVRLGAIADVLMVGEGIETCLAAMQATGRPAWAALSTSGLRALDLPPEARAVIILADGDDPGEAAAREAALRWKREGRSVRIARPPRGTDFNDLLLGRAPRIEQDTV